MTFRTPRLAVEAFEPLTDLTFSRRFLPSKIPSSIMAIIHKVSGELPASPETELSRNQRGVRTKLESASVEQQEYAKDETDEALDNIRYPPPWKWEKYCIGGYSQDRMLKFKNLNTMYKAIKSTFSLELR